MKKLKNDIYEMEIAEKTEDTLRVHFHYCPYVEEWEKQGYSGFFRSGSFL